MILQQNPSFIELVGYEDRKEKLKSLLSYVDKKVDYEIRSYKRLKAYFAAKDKLEEYNEHMAALKASRIKCALIEGENTLWTYSGLRSTIEQTFFDLDFKNNVQYPERGYIPWHRTPKHDPRPYQLAAEAKLFEAKHGGVEIGTGLGKSYIIMLLAKYFALKTVILTPSISIAYQLYEQFVIHFGKKNVGAFFDGKKDYTKRFVIAVAASITRVEEGSLVWEELSKAKVFIADESHLCPAVTLAHICFGIVKDAPYRFFFSGTQLRNDGLDMLLEGIVGPIVHRMTVREGVDQGYLAKPLFKMIHLVSNDKFVHPDPNKMTRKHLYYNDKVNRLAADLINKSVTLKGHSVLVLIEEMEQFSKLLNYLRVPVQFAHGGLLNKDQMKKVPKEYHKSDSTALVEAFNAKEIPLLIGTSCISTGTDIQANQTTIYLQGGCSEIQVRQGPIGRSTRLFEGKKECFVFDFDVENIEVTHRHAEARTAIYDATYGPVENVWVK
jgi:superfamily II DNA or RNA helicase